jgi:hypothetical protein
MITNRIGFHYTQASWTFLNNLFFLELRSLQSYLLDRALCDTETDSMHAAREPEAENGLKLWNFLNSKTKLGSPSWEWKSSWAFHYRPVHIVGWERIQPQKYPACLPSLVRRQRALFLTSLLKRYANPPQGDFNLWPWGGKTDSVWKMLEQIGRLTSWGSLPSPTTASSQQQELLLEDQTGQEQTGPNRTWGPVPKTVDRTDRT